MAAVDCVATVDVRDDGVSDLLWTGLLIAGDLLEIRLLVGACVRAQYCLVVHVVCICAAAARVIRGEAEDIKIVFC